MKEEQLLRAIGSLADDLILEAKAPPLATKRISKPLRRCLIAALVALLLAAAVSAAYVLTNWDDIFADRFSPSQEMQAQLEDNLGQPVETATRDGATLSVSQTLCDGNTLYAVVELQLPETFDMSTLIVSSEDTLEPETLKLFSSYDEATGHWYTGPATDRAEWFQGTLPQEELEALTVEAVEADVDYYGFQVGMGSGTFLPKRVDVANKTVFYFLHMDYDPEQAGPVTIWFENIDAENTLSGPLYLSFTPSFTSNSKTYSLTADGETVGSITVSPLTFQLEIPDVGAVLEEPLSDDEYRALVQQVETQSNGSEALYASLNLTFTLENGETQTFIPWGLGCSYDQETDTISLSCDYTAWTADTLIDLAHLTGITIGRAQAQMDE